MQAKLKSEISRVTKQAYRSLKNVCFSAKVNNQFQEFSVSQLFNMKKIQSEDLFVLTGDAIGLSMEMKSQAVHTE